MFVSWVTVIGNFCVGSYDTLVSLVCYTRQTSTQMSTRACKTAWEVFTDYFAPGCARGNKITKKIRIDFVFASILPRSIIEVWRLNRKWKTAFYLYWIYFHSNHRYRNNPVENNWYLFIAPYYGFRWLISRFIYEQCVV